MLENPTDWYVIGGLLIGAIFGAIVRQQRMCLVAAFSYPRLSGDYRYAIGFVAAALVGISGTQLLEIYDIVDISSAPYRNATLDWLGVLLGGLVFGIGATLAGGDAARIVVLAGQGSKSGWIALFFFAIFASVAQFGLLAELRVGSTHTTAIELVDSDAGIASMLSVSPWIVLAVVDVILLGLIIKWKKHLDIKILLAGIVLGSTVIAAWYTTGVLAMDEFDPKSPSAITVSGPMSRTGTMIVSGEYPALSFAMSFVIGLLAISFVLAVLTRKFSFSPVTGSVGQIAFGGSLMGIGGTFAYGCSVGQGFSGLSTLSLESVIAVLSMVAGINIATRWLEKR